LNLTKNMARIIPNVIIKSFKEGVNVHALGDLLDGEPGEDDFPKVRAAEGEQKNSVNNSRRDLFGGGDRDERDTRFK